MQPAPKVPRGAVVVVAALALAITLLLLGLFDPANAGFFPRCPFFGLTGLQCPGCGTTRALYALLHGDVPAALRLNPFTLLLLLLAVAKLLTPSLPRWALAPVAVAIAAAAAIFGVVRNL